MAYNKRTWLGRQGTGLNKFSIGGASPVTIVNQPDSVTQTGDALSAGNLNDLEDRIEDAFDETASQTEVTNLNNAINQLDHRVENLEQAHGSYVVQNYKDGSITPSGKGKWCVVEGVEGVSRVENNHLNKSFSPSTTINNVTFTNNGDGSWTVSTNGTASGTAYVQCCNDIPALGHKWLISGCPSGGNGLSGFTLWDASNSAYDNGSGVVFSPTNAINVYIRVASGTSIPTPIMYWPVLTDLNVYFNTSDLSFLGATDSAKLATIQTNYPHLLTPSEYGTRIVDSSYSGVRAWARNIWDEEWDNGTIDSSGNNASGSTVRCKNYIPVVPSGTYYFLTPIEKVIAIAEYDADKNFIKFVYANGDIKTVENNCFYIRFYVLGTGYTSYTNDICINQSDSQNGTYTPYHAPSTLSFPSTTLKSAGSVRDTLELNVEAEGVAKKRTTQRIASTALDNKTWVRRNDGLFYTSTPVFSDAKDSSSNVLCDKFLPCPSGKTGTSTPEGCISVNSGGYIYAMKAGIADTTAFLAYVADSVLYSEAKTESVTLSDPIIDNTLLTEAYGRMSTVQTGTVVDGIADLGFITL